MLKDVSLPEKRLALVETCNVVLEVIIEITSSEFIVSALSLASVKPLSSLSRILLT